MLIMSLPFRTTTRSAHRSTDTVTNCEDESDSAERGTICSISCFEATLSTVACFAMCGATRGLMSSPRTGAELRASDAFATSRTAAQIKLAKAVASTAAVTPAVRSQPPGGFWGLLDLCTGFKVRQAEVRLNRIHNGRHSTSAGRLEMAPCGLCRYTRETNARFRGAQCH